MLAMPSHTNPMGNIFGGWIMSVMDAAALMTATKIANGTVVTGLWCTNGVGDGLRPLCLCSGDLPGERHAEAGHAVDHRAGDPGLDLLRGQSPSPKAPADQNLVPVESGFHERALPIADGFLPAHSTLPGEHLDVLVTPSGLGLCSIAENRV